MARTNCDVHEAQGKMDFYFRDPNSWGLDKNAEKNGKVPLDYGKAPDTQRLLLVALWAGLVTAIAGRIFTVQSGMVDT